MSIPTFLTIYAISLPVFLVIDLLWIGFLAKGFYNGQIGALRGDINWTAALLFYGIFLLGLNYFAVYPAVEKGSAYSAFLLGGLFVFFCYAAYNLTNMATLQGWTWPMVLVDTTWGLVFGASVAGVTYLIYTNLIG